MCGGDSQVLESLQPYFKSYAKAVQLFGSHGAGQHAKMANQVICAGNMIGVVEGLLYASKMKLDLHQIVQTTMKGFANSVYLTTFGHKIVDNDMNPVVYAEYFGKDMAFPLRSRKSRFGIAKLGSYEKIL